MIRQSASPISAVSSSLSSSGSRHPNLAPAIDTHSETCAPQKVYPALIARVRPTIVDCFWPVFFFADHKFANLIQLEFMEGRGGGAVSLRSDRSVPP